MKTAASHPFRYSFTTCFKEQIVVDLLSPGPGRRILEMGCGTAYFATVLETRFPQSASYVGLDVSYGALSAACSFLTSGQVVVQGDVEGMPFGDSEFDDILYLDAMEHVEGDLASLREAFRVLKPGGRLLVSTPNRKALLTDTVFCDYMHDHGAMSNQRSGYSREDLQRLLRQSGFVVETTGYSNVFFSELLITLTKLGYRWYKPSYTSQADVVEVSEGALFWLHKKVLFPIGYAVGRLEDWILKPVLQGHCLIQVARKPV